MNEIIDIFALSKNQRLFAVQWKNCEVNAFEEVLDFFTDAQALFNFFVENQSDLQRGFFGSITVDDAVARTRREALALKRELLQLDKRGSTQHYSNLNELFQPLSKSEFKPAGFERHKAYGYLQKSMIRIYAVKLDTNIFLVTGGAIKLTAVMQDREHTLKELQKLQQTIDYLKDNGIYL